MRFEKPALTIKQQVDLLCRRGLVGDAGRMQQCLKAVSYYRLSGYWYPFRGDDNTFKPDTSFTEVWRRYMFDRRLRLLVMDAIGRIEVAVRSKLAHYHALVHGAFAYAAEASSLPKLTPGDHASLLERIETECPDSYRSSLCACSLSGRGWSLKIASDAPRAWFLNQYSAVRSHPSEFPLRRSARASR